MITDYLDYPSPGSSGSYITQSFWLNQFFGQSLGPVHLSWLWVPLLSSILLSSHGSGACSLWTLPDVPVSEHALPFIYSELSSPCLGMKGLSSLIFLQLNLSFGSLEGHQVSFQQRAYLSTRPLHSLSLPSVQHQASRELK